jgi:hypothetical protein
MKYCRRFLCIVSLLFLLSNNLSAQNAAAIKGKLVDSVSSAPLAFATVQVFDKEQKKLVNGNLVSESGEFSIDLPFGTYYAVIEFTGYSSFTTAQFVLSSKNPNRDFGTIRLASKTTVLQA